MSLAKPNPFAALLQKAAALPKTTGAVERYQARFIGAGSLRVVLADVSASMAGPASGTSKIEVLREALRSAPFERLVAFSSLAQEVPSADGLPRPSGGTALHLALDLAATMRPASTLVISDGEPDSEDMALDAAGRLAGRIDVIYCGPEGNAKAQAFLARLARVGGGQYMAHDMASPAYEPRLGLGPAVRGLLGGGSR